MSKSTKNVQKSVKIFKFCLKLLQNSPAWVPLNTAWVPFNSAWIPFRTAPPGCPSERPRMGTLKNSQKMTVIFLHVKSYHRKRIKVTPHKFEKIQK